MSADDLDISISENQSVESDQAPLLCDLGPFDPPTDFEFESELQATSPRDIPEEFAHGRHARGKRRLAWGFLLSGVLCLIGSFIPFVQLCGIFFLPLQYLNWIGAVFFVVGIGSFMPKSHRDGPYSYVIEGVPTVVRVREMVLQPTVLQYGKAVSYHIAVLVDFLNPDTGEVDQVATKSNEISCDLKDRLTTSFRIGEYVTALYCSGNPGETLRIYGLLDLKPGIGLIERENVAGPSLAKNLLIITFIFGLFGVLLWNLYAFGKYYPVEIEFKQAMMPFGIGSLILGGGAIAFFVFDHLAQKNRRDQRNQQAWMSGEAMESEANQHTGVILKRGWLMSFLLVAGSLLMGGMISLNMAFSANALLDESKATLEPVQIDEMIMTTHAFICREYQIKYHFSKDGPDGQTHSQLSTPMHMDQFEQNIAVADVRSGKFGWPWVKTITPVKINQIAKPANADEK